MLFSEDRNSDPTSENVGQDNKVNVEEAGVNLDYVKRELDEEELELEHKQYKIALTFENVFGESSTEQISNRDTLIGFLDGDVIMKIEMGTVKLEEENMVLIRKIIEQSRDIKECIVEDGNKVDIEATVNLDCVKNEPNEEALDFEEDFHATHRVTLEYDNIFGEPSHQRIIKEDSNNLIGFLDSDVIMANAMIKLEAIKEENDGSSNNIRDTIDEITEDSTEAETKVEVEETSVNLNCMKNELAEEVVKLEENLHVTQYRVMFENIFGICSSQRNLEEYDGNLIGFLNNDAIMENVIIKLEDIKEEGGNLNYCNKCNGDYKGFCLKCSSLSHVLNNASQLTSPESEINTVPEDILEIRDILVEKGVFLLKTLPKNIIFGPFEGISAMGNTKGDGWQINNRRLENAENGNWMKNIRCATSALIKNLDIFQMKGNLYFKTNRDIMECEELLVCYDDEEVIQMGDSQKCYFIPRKQEDLPKIFACTLCCLGFQLVRCLMEHKSKCPHADHNTEIKDFELVECHCCEIWLKKQEYQEYHMGYCLEKYLKLSCSRSQQVNRNQLEVEEVEDGLDNKALHGEFKCSQCSYETNDEKNLQKHLNTHKKPFQCGICMKNFTLKSSLKTHIKDKHTENGCAKDYQCSECTYQTNRKHLYQVHLNGHRGIKPFKCGICMKNFTLKSCLKTHIKDKHTENGCAKDYKCSECTYQTNRKHLYQIHLNGHRGIKSFKCGTCKMTFTQKHSLKKHIKNKHTGNGGVKDYQCSQCSYQTNVKRDYQRHLNRHRGIKPFECGICNAKFTQKSTLKMHIKNTHTENGCAKDYQCSECTYQTNRKPLYQIHLNEHRGIKPFECDICKMKFTKKSNLKMHIKNTHTENGGVKDYQCSECNYQTNRKPLYQNHLNGHRGIKPFECCTCKMKFAAKSNLNRHIKNTHTENGGGKDYQCSECNYQTNFKTDYQGHLNGHRGIKPFECGTCLKKFTRKDHLKSHIKNTHTENGGVKDYQCSECVYQTNSRNAYQQHLNMHRGIKLFECVICNTKFSQKGHLKSHVKSKHTENVKPFECVICKMKFTQEYTLKNHITNKHSERKF